MIDIKSLDAPFFIFSSDVVQKFADVDIFNDHVPVLRGLPVLGNFLLENLEGYFFRRLVLLLVAVAVIISLVSGNEMFLQLIYQGDLPNNRFL